ncbi:hypothetical protein F511_28525 [Dorcoceras hygrometricum]|uniref:Uncharacterized protein n=1 Tax=Dorcoceras hygrometricum TaxID=472368 RepID=A0A2Z7AUL0_9LAMI|nr:hypothetical protein F511_28525 [Dorcoceras hygrometricum]
MSASGESSTTMNRLLHASGSHPIPPPDDPKDTASRGPTTIVAPESQFRTCPTDHVGTYNLFTAIVAVGPVVDRSTVPKRILNDVQHRIQVEGFCDFFVQHAYQSISSDSSSESVESIRVTSPDAIPKFSSSSSTSSRSENLNSSRSSSSSDSPMHFTTDDIPLDEETTANILQIEETPDAQISLPTVGVPSTEYTEAVAQLRATVDKIFIEQVQTRFHLEELKAALSKGISNLETAFITASDNQDRAILVQTNILRNEMQDQKTALSEELADIPYINRGRDDKKGEGSSSRGPQPPDDQSRTSGGGSRSEPSRKRGSGYRGGGRTSSIGFRYWLGGS